MHSMTERGEGAGSPTAVTEGLTQETEQSLVSTGDHMGPPLQILPSPSRNVVGRGPCAPPRLSNCCRMLTAGCGHPALQHRKRPSLELVGAGACRQPADAGRRERRPLQGLQNALSLIVGVDAHTPAAR